MGNVLDVGVDCCGGPNSASRPNYTTSGSNNSRGYCQSGRLYDEEEGEEKLRQRQQQQQQEQQQHRKPQHQIQQQYQQHREEEKRKESPPRNIRGNIEVDGVEYVEDDTASVASFATDLTDGRCIDCMQLNRGA